MPVAYHLSRAYPIPPSNNHGGPRPSGSKCRYPWRRMQIGHSFFIPGMKNFHHLHKVARKVCGITVVARRVPGGIRVWRIA